MSDFRTGWKVLTHDLRSPLQGGAPLFADGALPITLPRTSLDTSSDECAAGWNYARDPESALRIGGFWPTGWPSRLFLVEAGPDAIKRGDKLRASVLTFVREATEEETRAAIERFSTVFGAHAAAMAEEQCAWRRALGRPQHDAAVVERALAAALASRGLAWSLQRYDTAWAAWAAWAAWDAMDALRVAFSAFHGRIQPPPDDVTIRDAYAAGLGVAVPVRPSVLGWAMVPEETR